jgi:hypothetical protein
VSAATGVENSVVRIVSNVVSAALGPLLAFDTDSPALPSPLLWSVLAWARREIGDVVQGFSNQTPAKQQENVLYVDAEDLDETLAALAVAPDANVLLIGTDGTNLSRILADPAGTPNFHALMQDSTTAASTIVGHTTLSNPSWSAT